MMLNLCKPLDSPISQLSLLMNWPQIIQNHGSMTKQSLRQDFVKSCMHSPKLDRPIAISPRDCILQHFSIISSLNTSSTYRRYWFRPLSRLAPLNVQIMPWMGWWGGMLGDIRPKILSQHYIAGGLPAPA